MDIATAKGTLHNGQTVTDTLLGIGEGEGEILRLNSLNIGKRGLPIFILNNLSHRNQTYNTLGRMRFTINSTFDMKTWLFFRKENTPSLSIIVRLRNI